MQQQTIIFLGPQGCGKGTQLKLLGDYLTHTDPSRTILTPAMGNMLRELAAGDTYTAQLLKPVLEQGSLVEYAVSVSLFGHFVMQHIKEEQHLLIDGFPRSIEQVHLVDSLMRFYRRQSPTIVRIEISDEESLKRLLIRGRSDDTKEAISARLAWTRKAEKEIEEWFVAKGYRVVEIDGMGTIDETQQKIRTALSL